MPGDPAGAIQTPASQTVAVCGIWHFVDPCPGPRRLHFCQGPRRLHHCRSSLVRFGRSAFVEQVSQCLLAVGCRSHEGGSNVWGLGALRRSRRCVDSGVQALFSSVVATCIVVAFCGAMPLDAVTDLSEPCPQFATGKTNESIFWP